MKYEEWIEYERARLAANRLSLLEKHETAEPKPDGSNDDRKSGEERQADVDQKEEGGAVFPV